MDLRATSIQVSLPGGRKLFSISDLKISSGSHVLVQGESGSGKTTFLHLLAGLFSPNAGQVHLGETDITALNDSARCHLRLQKIGVIFQKLNLLDHLTVAENVQLAHPGVRADEVAAALVRVGLKGRDEERVVHMSVGEQQRVAVARVLAQAPPLILADEPTSALDETNTRFIVQALKNAARGKTLIVVSHDHRIADQFDRVIAFKEFCR
jgi:putative ABC transport system ATP-binding protein